jgi:hypothetical protein
VGEYKVKSGAYFSFVEPKSERAEGNESPLPEINIDYKAYKKEGVRAKVVGHVSLKD